MASSIVDLVKINVTSLGTGALTLGAAVPGYRGVDVLTSGNRYGTYLGASNQLIRSPIGSSLGGTAINLAPNAQVAFVVLASDLSPVQLTADAQAAAITATTKAAQTALDALAVSAGVNNLVNGQRVFPYAYASALPQGVTSLSAAGVATGSGGTAGTYAGGVSGGPTGFTWQYTIGSDGKIASYSIVSKGLSTTTTAPTLSYPSGGVNGATVPITTVSNIVLLSETYWAATSDSKAVALWQNTGTGSPVAVTNPDATQVISYTKAGVDVAVAVASTAVSAANLPMIFDAMLPIDRNIFDYTRVNDNQQMTAYSGAGTGGVLSALTGQFVTPLMEVTAGATYSVPINVTRGVYFNAAGVAIAAATMVSVDTYHFTFTPPTGQGIFYVQLQGDKGYIAAGSYPKIDIHQGARTAFRQFALIEGNQAIKLAADAAVRVAAPNYGRGSLLDRASIQRGIGYSNTGVLTSASTSMATGLLPIAEGGGLASTLGGFSTLPSFFYFDAAGAMVCCGVAKFMAIFTAGSPNFTISAYQSAGTFTVPPIAPVASAPLMQGLLMQDATNGNNSVLPANAIAGPVTVAPYATGSGNVYTMRDATGAALPAVSGQTITVTAGGCYPGVRVIPPAGLGIVASAFHGPMNAGSGGYYGISADDLDIYPYDAGSAAEIRNAGTPSAILYLANPHQYGLAMGEAGTRTPWLGRNFSVDGDSLASGPGYTKVVGQITRARWAKRSAVPGRQLHELFNGCGNDGSGPVGTNNYENWNFITGNLNGVLTAADYVGVELAFFAPLGNAIGYFDGTNITKRNATGDHRQPYPIGVIANTAPVAVVQVTTTAGSAVVNIVVESGKIIPGTSCLFPSNALAAPGNLGGLYITSQSSITSSTAATASFSTNQMTVVTGTGFAIGQTISGANVPANIKITSYAGGSVWILSNTVGTLATQAVSATNQGGDGTYNVNNGAGVAAVTGQWTIVGTFYGTLNWALAQYQAFNTTNAGKMVPVMMIQLRRYDCGSGNGGLTDPTNPGNPANINGDRATDYRGAALAVCAKTGCPYVDLFNAPFCSPFVAPQFMGGDNVHVYDTITNTVGARALGSIIGYSANAIGMLQ
jgi:hypothetical protein